MFGVINVYKEKGMTSFDVIAKLRKILKEKRIGHTGTLDPNATGVLPVCVGNATKLVQYIINEDKEYIAKIKLGIETDSLDITGNIIKEEKVPILEFNDIKEVCLNMIGKIDQIPPMYSAKKYNGKKLYELAREGKEIERKSQKIEIYSIDDIEYSKENSIIEFRVYCSKGTYIRTLCQEILEKLNVIGTLAELERTKTGIFVKRQSLKLSEIEEMVKTENTKQMFCNVEDIFCKYENIHLSNKELNSFLNGVKIVRELKNGMYKIYTDEQFIGIGECTNNMLKRKVVL